MKKQRLRNIMYNPVTQKNLYETYFFTAKDNFSMIC